MADSILIIGAEGFIGKALRDRLADRYALICVDRREVDQRSEAEICLSVDINSPLSVDAVWKELHPERLKAVVFLAAYYDFSNKPDPRYDHVVNGLQATLDKMAETLRPDVPLLFSSSMAAMAPTEPGAPQKPESNRLGAWAYPSHKLDAETVLERARIPNPRVEMVLAGVYSDWCELVPLYKQIERVRARSVEAIFYPGPTDRGLTYVHVDDVARAFEKAISANHQRPVERYLIGEETPVTYEFIHETASDVFFGKPLPLFRVPAFIAWIGAWILGMLARIVGKRRFVQPWMVKFAGEHFEFDISRTRAGLGWQPTRSLNEELPDICRRADEKTELWLEKNDARPF